jgi:dipeptidyl aminopeptidase/acylaminoacyl peptidase
VIPARAALRFVAAITLAAFAGSCGNSAPTSGPPTSTVPASPTLSPSPATGSAEPSPSPSVEPNASPSAAPTPSPTAPTGLLLYFRGPVEGTLNGSAWVIPSTGGKARSLGPAIEASWAADGQSIHLVRLNPTCVPQLRTVTPDGKVVSVVGSGFRAGDAAFAWSPDERRVVFVRYHNGAPRGSCGSQGGVLRPSQMVADIVVMYANGVGKRVLMARVWPGRPLAWSPDSSRIAVARSTHPVDASHQVLDLVRIPGGAVTNLGRKLGSTNLEGLSPPTWSSDGTHLAFTVYRGTTHAMVAAVDGSSLRNLGSGTTRDYEPGWAPDGDHVAVAYNIAKNGTIVGGGLSIRSIDGQEVRDLGLTNVQVFAGSPSWSPGGNRIAYIRTVTDAGGGLGGIVVIWPDGSHPRVLGGTRGADWVAWQPSP